ncbi:MAG: hypothetical protein U0736_00375 [Gemmataceae bacterium]
MVDTGAQQLDQQRRHSGAVTFGCSVTTSPMAGTSATSPLDGIGRPRRWQPASGSSPDPPGGALAGQGGDQRARRAQQAGVERVWGNGRGGRLATGAGGGSPGTSPHRRNWSLSIPACRIIMKARSLPLDHARQLWTLRRP